MKALRFALIFGLLFAGTVNGWQQPASPSKGWSKYSPESCGLSLELRGQPQSVAVPIPEALASGVHYANGYMYVSESVIVVIIHVSAKTYLPPKTMAEGVVKGIITNPQVTDLNYTTEPSTETQASLQGSFKQNGLVIAVEGIALSQDKHGWIITSAYRQDNAESKSESQHILSSIKLDGPPCREQKDTVGARHGTDAGPTALATMHAAER